MRGEEREREGEERSETTANTKALRFSIAL